MIEAKNFRRSFGATAFIFFFVTIIRCGRAIGGTECIAGEVFDKKANSCIPCPQGYFGVNCTESCPAGHYGNGCQSLCPQACRNTCDFITGECSQPGNGQRKKLDHLITEMPQQPLVKRSTYCLLMLFWIALHDRSKTFGQGLDIACNDSLATVEPKQCPKNKAERDVAAAKKNCGSLKNSCRSFEYHCVINEWMNGTIDVCAPSMVIQKGKCAEFSTGFKSIRINFLTDCKKYDPPCPESYNSTEAYKYGGCYDMAILTPPPTTTFQMTTASGTTFMENSSLTTVRGGNDILKESEANVLKVLIIVFIVIFVIAVIASIIIFIMKKSRRSSNGKANKPEEEEALKTI